jgi:hypothetical protein
VACLASSVDLEAFLEPKYTIKVLVRVLHLRMLYMGILRDLVGPRLLHFH